MKPESKTRPSGFLEGYKTSYLAQPKLVRVGVMPALIACIASISPIFNLQEPRTALILFGFTGFFIFLNAYNQHIETDERAETDERLSALSTELKLAERKARIESHVGMFFNELVLQKSETFIEALEAATKSDTNGRTTAITGIREKNDTQIHLDRLMANLRTSVFEKIARTQDGEQIRIAYFTPSEDDQRLELKSHAPVHFTQTIEKGGGAASIAWTSNNDELFFIDDVDELCRKEGAHSPFVYLHNGQRSTIQSIVTFRVFDAITGLCYGIVCIDSNVIGMFTDRIGRLECKMLAAAIRARIIYETRFGLMKGALPRTNSTT